MPMNRKKYPANWNQISMWVRRDRAKWRCEGSPAYPNCRAEQGKEHPVTGSIVVLTVSHLNHVTFDCRPENLRAMCQRCHLTHDLELHQRNRRRNKIKAQRDAGQMELFRGGKS